MLVKEIPLNQVEVSEFNARKDMIEGQQDSTLSDLARSIEKQGLLCPITVYMRADGRYSVIAGQRRMTACRMLGWESITAVVRYAVDGDEALALSLVENVHRADMNPRDKARAFKLLLDRLGDVNRVSDETGVSITTIRKYLHLLELAPELQERLAVGAVKNTEALMHLSKKFDAPQKQLDVWDRIDGFTQDVQVAVIRRLEPDLTNLEALVDHAREGVYAVAGSRRCPFDCPAVPEALKRPISILMAAYALRETRGT